MPKGTNNMDNKSDEKFTIMQAAIEANKQEMKSNKQESDEKMTQFTLKFEKLFAVILNQLKTLEYSPTQKNKSNPSDTTTVVPDNRRDKPLNGVHYNKMCGMWTLKHDISSPKFYELLLNIELKGETDLDLRKFYNNIKMCLNVVTIIQEDLLPGPFHKNTLQFFGILHPRLGSPFLFLECPYIHFPWTLNISGND